MLGLRKLVLTNQKNIHEIIKLLDETVKTQRRIINQQKSNMEIQGEIVATLNEKLGPPISRQP